ncbi:MAG TPA: glycosyltransferase family 39 protein [Mycobacteriales bacterium]|nr:glycosyltransferase family 39 protein [Mycobacteriales bacterium]
MTVVLERPIDGTPAAPPPPTARRDPRWVRPSLIALLIGTAVLYLWGLGASGYANGFYSAAVEAGSKSWKALFFGSFDSSSFITVDKPPASLWVMDLSARLFGVNAWSILVPQALEGVATVALLYATVRRRFSPAAGLLAGAAMAVTPVAALMFRFNNPDALLVLLLVASAYAMVRALEAGSTKWIVLAGTFVGFGFLTKMLQAFLVLPGFAAVYLYAAPTPLLRRVRQVLIGGVATLVSAGWWVAIVALTPASDRPYIGGSQHNSILELILGYNGIGRLTGQETGSVGGATNGAGRWGATGIGRMFNSEFGGQVSWLIPAALVLLAGMLWLGRLAPRTNGQRAQVLLWGSWLVVTGLTFSLAAGIIHPYYSVALAPAVAALVGIGAVGLWRHRGRTPARLVLASALLVTVLWSSALLDLTPSWHPSLRVAILVVGLAATAAIAGGSQLQGRIAAVVVAAALLAGLAGPAAYAVSTVASSHNGAIPSAGPSGQGFAGPGGPGGGPGGRVGPGGPGGLGGLLDSSTPSTALTQLLEVNASSYTWVAAAVGSNSAAGVQLATGLPVMAIGGFNGTDPTPTLAEFETMVKAGKIHYFLAGGGGGFGPGGGSQTSSAITAWVESTYAATTVGGVTVYDLSG